MDSKTSSEVILDIDGLSKTFPARNGNGEGVTVLRDINLKVYKGDFIAIIGRNGSGKTTLLKMIAGILRPTTGKISIYKNLLAITDLGSGIVPECSGYENIRMMGILYGIRGGQLDEMAAAVEDFSELGEKLHMPVKHFSQGMYLRLAFSIIVFLKLDLIVFDEVLAVGDIAFRQKCLDHISELSKSGCTIIYVTHSFEEVSEYCTRCILIEDGRIKMDGDPALIYKTYVSESARSAPKNALDEKDFEYTEHAASIRHVQIRSNGKYTNEVQFNESFDILVEWQKRDSDTGVTLTAFIYDLYGKSVLSTSDTYAVTRSEMDDLRVLPETTYMTRCTVPGYFLNIGYYHIHISVSLFRSIDDFAFAGISTAPLSLSILSNESVNKEYGWKYSHSPIRTSMTFERQFFSEPKKSL